MRARVARQPPAWNRRLPDEILQVRRATKTLLAAPRADAIGQRGDEIEHGEERLLDIGAHSMKLCYRPLDGDASEVLVSGKAERECWARQNMRFQTAGI